MKPKSNSRFFFVLAVFLFLFLMKPDFLRAQIPAAKKLDSLFSKLEGLTAVSVSVIDADTKTEIYSKNKANLITPASTVKLFTTAAALKLLGENYKFSLKIYSAAPVESGVIKGDLIIKGFGNPFFSDAKLDSLAKIIKEFGVKRIEGDIVCDDGFFDKNYSHRIWSRSRREEVPIAPVSAAIINRNEAEIKFIPRKNRSFDYEIKPRSSFYEINFKAKLVKKRSVPKIVFRTGRGKIVINISGKMRKRKRPFAYKAYLDNPPLFVANLFYERLQKEGIVIKGLPVVKESGFDAKYLLCEDFAPLEDVLSKTNKESDNFLAEVIFKTLGAEKCNCPGNAFSALQAVYSFAFEAGITEEEIKIVDGSGSSRANKLSAGAVVKLLSSMYDDTENFNLFYASLAAAGIDGTLEERLTGFGLKNNFHGKTGTLNGVSALSGYFTTLSGKNVIVSIIMNFNAHGSEFWREIQDEAIVEITTGY